MNEQTDHIGHPLYSEEVIGFVRACNAYCEWIEALDEAGPGEFIASASGRLAEVYYYVMLIGQPDPLMEGGNEKHVTEEDWSKIFQKVLQVLGPHNEYLRIADDDEFDRSDLVEHKISEDLADVYQDLKNFVMLFRQGLEELMNDALWEVMVNFEEYWGEKLLNAMRALHRLRVKKIDLEEFTGEADRNNDGRGIPKYDPSFFRKFQDQSGEDNDV